MEKSASSAVSVTVRVTEVATPSAVNWAQAVKAESKNRPKSLIVFDCCTNGSKAGHANTDALAQEMRTLFGGQGEQTADQVALGLSADAWLLQALSPKQQARRGRVDDLLPSCSS